MSRFEHTHIVGGSGHGKTQLLQYLISEDLKTNASLVVLDSQGDLINNLKYVVPPERLILIDPNDIEYPVCLNLFDVNMERINSYSMLDRQRMINGIIELYDFVIGSLLGAELSQKQSVPFRYVMRLMLHIPGATIHTMVALFRKDGLEPYREYVEKLSNASARQFFEDEFDSKEFRDTKQQVMRRLHGILENEIFTRMFSHPRSKVDLFSELNRGKIVLIDTAKDLLKQQGTQIFGRFFIAMITQAAQERAAIAPDKRHPTYVVIDEAHDYFDDHVATILDTARKYKMGLTLAHQHHGQLPARVADSVAVNTSTKFAGGLEGDYARHAAKYMHCDAEFIERQPKGSFAVFQRGKTPRAISVKVPGFVVEKLPKLSNAEFERVRDTMRKRYAVHYSELHAPEEAEQRKGTTTLGVNQMVSFPQFNAQVEGILDTGATRISISAPDLVVSKGYAGFQVGPHVVIGRVVGSARARLADDSVREGHYIELDIAVGKFRSSHQVAVYISHGELTVLIGNEFLDKHNIVVSSKPQTSTDPTQPTPW